MARRGLPMAQGGGQDLPRAETLSSAKASRHSARAKGFAPRRNAPLGEGLPKRRTSERICPAQEHAPRRKPPDTAHEQKNLPHARRLPSAKASRHGARAKGFAPRRNTPHGEGLPTRRTSERICPAGFVFAPRADERRAAPDRRTAGKTPLRRGRTRHGARAKRFAPRRNTLLGEGLPTRRTSKRICPAQERSPRRRPPNTAHERKDLPRARTLSSAKASRHGARAKGFAPRENTPHGEGLPTRRTSKRICPARECSPRRQPPDTAHERKDLPRARTLPAAKASRHGARAKGFAPQGSPSPHVPTNGGPPSAGTPTEKHPSAGSHPRWRGRCRVHSPKKNKTTP